MTRAERRAYWQRRIKAQEKSGKSIAAWCREKSINYKTFHRWKRNLKSKSSSVPEGWCEVEPKPTAKPAGSLRLVIDERITIELQSGFDRQLLREVLTVISQ
jgi:hypothetical protein